MLPGSTERVLSVSGVADAIHIAVYYIGNILLEYQDRPATGGGSSRDTYRQAGGRDSYGGDRREERREPRAPGIDISGPGVQTQQIFIPNDLVGSSESRFPFVLQVWLEFKLKGTRRDQRNTSSPSLFSPSSSPTVIGKAGAKINEIRTASSTQVRSLFHHSPLSSVVASRFADLPLSLFASFQIRIMEPGQPGASANTDERLVTITGQPTGINMAIQLLYQVRSLPSFLPALSSSNASTDFFSSPFLLSSSQRLEQEKAARAQAV